MNEDSSFTQPPSDSTPLPDGRNAVSLHEPQRQSAWAIVFLALNILRRFGLGRAIVSAGLLISFSPPLLPLLAGVLLVSTALRWWCFTFVVQDGELRVNKGVFSRNTLTVPLDRVQSASIEQKFLHRFVHLVQVSIDTAGTNVTEFTIDAVDRELALVLQRLAADSQAQSAPEPEDLSAAAPDLKPATEDVEILRHSVGRLFRIAVSRSPLSGVALLAPILAFGDELFDFSPARPPQFALEAGQWSAAAVPLTLAAIIASGTVLNLLFTFLRDWDLRVVRTSSGMRRESGLVSTVSVASSVPRVQSVTVQQSPLQQLFGLHQLTLYNVGEQDFSVPGCTQEEVAMIIRSSLKDRKHPPPLGGRVSAAEVFRNTRNIGVFATAMTFAGYFLFHWSSLICLVAVPVWWLLNRRSVRLRRWGLGPDSVVLHHERLGWKRQEALLKKVNGVSVRQSLFERARGLATVQVRLAGMRAGGSLSLGMIPIAEATLVRDRILFAVEAAGQHS